MNVLWSIHLYPPAHNCGAEYFAHDVNKFLLSKGHSVRVLLHQARRYHIKNVYEYEGVTVFPPDRNVIEGLYRWADIVITHLDYTGDTIWQADKYKKPVVCVVHNDIPYESIKQGVGDIRLVYNSEWIKEKLNYSYPGFVFTPPCDYRYYDIHQDTNESEYITLINLDYNKGGDVLAKIADAMPERKFLAVEGSYSFDDRGQQLTYPSNVKFVRNTPDILSIYRQTRILLMPSLYESWGRTATEAMCSGIPVISNKTPGLYENCGMAGIYVKDRNDIAEWVELIKKLDDPVKYKKASEKAKMRSRELDPLKKLEEFERWLRA